MSANLYSKLPQSHKLYSYTVICIQIFFGNGINKTVIKLFCVRF